MLASESIAAPRDGRVPDCDVVYRTLPQMRKGLLAPRCLGSVRTNLTTPCLSRSPALPLESW
eukprot:5186860-Pyramimonas_sp.AAC.1